MKERIYLLWYHGENGPEELTATSDPTMLEGMALSYNGDPTDLWVNEKQIRKLQAELPELIKRPQIVALHDGWGGLHVQSVDMFVDC